MGLFQYVIDSTTKKRMAYPFKYVAYPGFVDYTETVSGSSKSDFTLAVALEADHAVDVWVDGRLQMIENTNWSRTVATPGHIVLSEAIVVGKVFKARVYTK